MSSLSLLENSVSLLNVSVPSTSISLQKIPAESKGHIHNWFIPCLQFNIFPIAKPEVMVSQKSHHKYLSSLCPTAQGFSTVTAL